MASDLNSPDNMNTQL